MSSWGTVTDTLTSGVDLDPRFLPFRSLTNGGRGLSNEPWLKVGNDPGMFGDLAKGENVDRGLYPPNPCPPGPNLKLEAAPNNPEPGFCDEPKYGVEVVKDDNWVGHYHDTYGMSVGNILASLEYGLHTFDSSVGGLGGCPYSPGATGNVATEDVLRQQVQDTGRPERDRGSGAWMSKMLNRTNSSHVGKALEARRAREQLEKERERDGGPAESISAKL
ncbi:hypothetical protein L226DRAFT_616054 [Lentinus tigrinus ALCF2SS1-7]|uniref:uncharacterized protein n=1 Tax=Lentinus tigrinus ALCF2SS1-7 TaxID=1328758 RepID=UPI0011661745|nr:hypothetical protein L226DRAFT_616054 [Lentinus tigrinus ALCF2SS1-7]